MLVVSRAELQNMWHRPLRSTLRGSVHWSANARPHPITTRLYRKCCAPSPEGEGNRSL
jgi:hypothetical protein